MRRVKKIDSNHLHLSFPQVRQPSSERNSLPLEEESKVGTRFTQDFSIAQPSTKPIPVIQKGSQGSPSNPGPQHIPALASTHGPGSSCGPRLPMSSCKPRLQVGTHKPNLPDGPSARLTTKAPGPSQSNPHGPRLLICPTTKGPHRLNHQASSRETKLLACPRIRLPPRVPGAEPTLVVPDTC